MNIKNYTLLEEKVLDDLKCYGFFYEHNHSGAKIVYLKSDDENKVFSAAFKTPPEDDTGSPHILEHCVLNGCEKYPIKDPFNELSKGSLYTFLNAMTYPDKTLYPIASCNHADFFNLMDVYLSSVFFPMIYERKVTFLQEGWHYQLQNRDDELEYNGIVYNEMKGANSDPYDLLETCMLKALFPDTFYAYEYGGNPNHIPELTYEQFLDFHKKYYHPQNSLLFFYGDMDIEVAMGHLDAEYLSRFTRSNEDDFVITESFQKPFDSPRVSMGNYSATNEEDLGKNYLCCAFALPDNLEPKVITGLKLLHYILLSTSASPLYKALLESEIGDDIGSYFNTDTFHPIWSITIKNAECEANKMFDIIRRTLEHIITEGLDKKFIEACLNFVEFQAKEEDYGYRPKGLTLNSSVLCGWLHYQNQPFAYMEGLKNLLEIHTDCIENKYLENLIKTYILDNNHSAQVTLKPILNLDAQIEEETAAKLANIKAGLSDTEIDKIIKDYEELCEFQSIPDTPKALECIPLLKISDIKPEITKIPLLVKSSNAQKTGKILHSPLDTNEIIYNCMFFDTSAVPFEKLPYLRILQHILTKTATRSFSNQALTQEIKGKLGGLAFTFDILSRGKDDFAPFAVISAKSLSKNT
ncbi:MAG: insulinase family protein, partial [Defluviitaleaceae bacterium]|nr:insulinase family protein [Defluviitaleaceae bacterium]